MLFMNCLVHLYTCCRDRHASPYWTGVTTGCAWPGRGESVTELMLFMNCLVHLYTCCRYRHASPYWTGVTTGCAWPGRGESVTELMPFMNFLVHLYTCCSNRHAYPHWTDVTTVCAWPGPGESVTVLMLFVNFLVHSFTCCSDRHASPYLTLIRRWISMGFTLSLLEKRMTERCSSLVHVASRAATYTLLLRRRFAFLHHTASCRPLYKPSVSLLSTYRQSSCGSNCCRTFKIFISLFKIFNYFHHNYHFGFR